MCTVRVACWWSFNAFQAADFAIDAADAKLLADQGQTVLVAARDALSGLAEWTTPAIEAALRSSLIEGLGLKPRLAFGPIRVAVTGRRVSPPLFESLELLGAQTTLHRIGSAIQS